MLSAPTVLVLLLVVGRRQGGLCGGFKPAKPLVRWLLLPQPCVLSSPSPVRDLPFTTGGSPAWEV